MESYNGIQLFWVSLKGILRISVSVVFLKIFDFYKESKKCLVFLLEKIRVLKGKEN